MTRLIPARVDLGRSCAMSMAYCMGRYKAMKAGQINAHGRRTLMGFVLPDWQRGLVWTQAQKVAFIQSAWLGVPIGTYAYNQAPLDSPLDYLLIDGQQRMSAIQDYVENLFPVFGHWWSDLPPADTRRWELSTPFGCFITETTNESYLRGYYNLLNFGGTPHERDPGTEAEVIAARLALSEASAS